jgi:hypothetical protein
VIGGIGGFLLAGLVLRPIPAAGGTALTLLGFPLPTMCLFRLTTGLPCPSCGLTRSVALLMHGQPAASLALHPFGLVAVALALFQLPPRVVRAWGRDAAWIFRWDRIWAAVLGATVVLMMIWWTSRVGLMAWFAVKWL